MSVQIQSDLPAARSAAGAFAAAQAGGGFDAEALAGALAEAGAVMDRKAFLGLVSELFGDRATILSSFGAQSAVVLHLVSQAAPGMPVTFLNTGKLFGQTLKYRDQLLGQLGMLDNLRELTPAGEIDAEDPNGMLWNENPDRCCELRKVIPLNTHLEGFDCTLTGLRRAQGGFRKGVQLVEVEDGRIKINPIYDWSDEDVETAFSNFNLPQNPMVEQGYRSIGCMPCSAPESEGDSRDGRWASSAKTECGIHSRLSSLDKQSRKAE